MLCKCQRRKNLENRLLVLSDAATDITKINTASCNFIQGMSVLETTL